MGMGRATGRAVCGGGLLSEVPGFKELDKCGKSLGDVIGGGDEESARKRWTEEYVNFFFYQFLLGKLQYPFETIEH